VDKGAAATISKASSPGPKFQPMGDVSKGFVAGMLHSTPECCPALDALMHGLPSEAILAMLVDVMTAMSCADTEMPNPFGHPVPTICFCATQNLGAGAKSMGPPPRLVLGKGKGRAVETAMSISPRVQSAVSKLNPEVPPSDPKGKRIVKEITHKKPSVRDIPSASGSNPLNPFADSAADDNEPGSVGTSSSDWDLNQSVEVKQAAQADLPKLDLPEQDHRESSSAAAGPAAEEAVSTAAQGESQQKLNKKQRRAQQKKQAALDAAVAEASLSTSPADSPRAAEAASATTAESAADQESQLLQPSPQRAVQSSAESSAAVGASARTELAQLADQSSKQVGSSVAPPVMGDLQLPPRPRPPPGLPRRRPPSVPDVAAEPAPERPVSPSLASATAALDAILPLPTAGAESPLSARQLAADSSNSMWTVYQAGLYSDNYAELGYEPDLGHGPPPDYLIMPVRSTAEDIAAPAAAAAAEGLPFAALEQLPSMSFGRLPSGTLDQLPSTSSPQLPTDVEGQLQRSTSGQLPSSASHQLLPSSLDQVLGASASQQPSTSSGQLTSTPSEQAPPSRRGPELAEELQRALAGKPKPRASRTKAANKLPEPSRDLVLQRALMEKPRPRARPPRVSRPSNEDAVNGTDTLTDSWQQCVVAVFRWLALVVLTMCINFVQ
jgi:hypothetical protein